ncbi:MAG: hypothetical protein Q7T56_12480 [Nocardioidaceae bacterium]|nr:hypothetical protein [Nocardioidaceae bacterium]
MTLPMAPPRWMTCHDKGPLVHMSLTKNLFAIAASATLTLGVLVGVGVSPASSAEVPETDFLVRSTDGGDGQARTKGTIEWTSQRSAFISYSLADECPQDNWGARSTIVFVQRFKTRSIEHFDGSGCGDGSLNFLAQAVKVDGLMEQVRVTSCEVVTTQTKVHQRDCKTQTFNNPRL